MHLAKQSVINIDSANSEDKKAIPVKSKFY